MAKCANIAEFADIAEFFWGLYLKLLFERYEWRHFRIDYIKSSIFNFYLIAFGGVFNSTHFNDLLHTNLKRTRLDFIVKLIIKFKNCSTYHMSHMTSFRSPTRFSFFEKKIAFLFSYRRMGQYRRICQYRRNFFPNSAILGFFHIHLLTNPS